MQLGNHKLQCSDCYYMQGNQWDLAIALSRSEIDNKGISILVSVAFLLCLSKLTISQLDEPLGHTVTVQEKKMSLLL